jgi:hypothetical protein
MILASRVRDGLSQQILLARLFHATIRRRNGTARRDLQTVQHNVSIPVPRESVERLYIRMTVASGVLA